MDTDTDSVAPLNGDTPVEEDDVDFVLDATGVLEEEKIAEEDADDKEEEQDPGVSYSLDVSLTDPQANGDDSSGQPGGRGGPGRSTCYNCQGKHGIRQCPYPQDEDRIDANMMRSELIAGAGGRTGDFKPAPLIYSYVKPGKISYALRGAMGLDDNELPAYVYNMRHYGYPPGWLKKARVVKARLDVYQGDDGSDDDSAKPLFDKKKIFEYPGFNALMPSGVLDESERFSCPPLQEHNLTDNWEPVLKFSSEVDVNEDEDAVEESPFKDAVDIAEDEDAANDANVTCEALGLSYSVPSFHLLNPEFVDDAPAELPKPVRTPGLDKWTVNISEHIPYENLPGATGNYDMLRKAFVRHRQKAADEEKREGERRRQSVNHDGTGSDLEELPDQEDVSEEEEEVKSEEGSCSKPEPRRRRDDEEVEEGEVDDDEDNS